MSHTSELVTLVETEHRLDAEVASARIAADGTREAARERARVALAEVDVRIEAERARIAQAFDRETSERERALEAGAREQIARFDAVRGDVLDRIARELARRLISIALEDS